MSWGDALAEAYSAATDAARQAAVRAASSAQAAASAAAEIVQDAASQAADAARQAAARTAAAARAAASATADAAQTAARATANAAVETAKATGRVAGFGVRAATETGKAALQGTAFLADKALEAHPMVGGLYKAAKEQLSPTATPRQRVAEPCPNSLEAKIDRLNQRESLIDKGRGPGGTPTQKAAAERLARNNQAVELARLSGDSYDQYAQPPKNTPPLGWTVMSDAELAEAGIGPDLLQKAKATIYRTPEDWPGGQRTVLAFRGTVPSEMADLQTNMDQALGGETAQYKAATQLGASVARKLGPDVLVTGHSLGGGKAQAAGVSGGLTGMMFNAAGLNPDTVGGDTGDPSDFLQFRTPGDPLTGIQNSAALQSGVGLLAGGLGSAVGVPAAAGNFIADKLGFPFLSPDTRQLVEGSTTALPRALGNLVRQGSLLPPAIGPVVTVPALDDAGNAVPMTSPGGQHSIVSVINGIEREKSEDVATLQGASQ